MRALFRLEQSMANNPAVNRWFDSHRGPLGDLALHWFKIIRLRPAVEVNADALSALIVSAYADLKHRLEAD